MDVVHVQRPQLVLVAVVAVVFAVVVCDVFGFFFHNTIPSILRRQVSIVLNQYTI